MTRASLNGYAKAKQNGTGAAPAEVKLLNIEHSMQQATICIFASRIDQYKTVRA